MKVSLHDDASVFLVMIERRLFSDMWILYPEALASMAMNTSDNYMLNKVFD